ncbi:methyltransferase domain-containing protein [Psychrobacillus sp. MER TA 171]|uniref:class I SAM-dependent methyltransferase n=1 Tax=Psychrobacillus sp. MER TA 171 TaxID=2939577 RepID=UPI0020420371|nr:methyltransferase domain-containing protein [Psychrobacillus sp. MER TA 171]MCM3357357.1 methyltransferase domain-containing protein [Psychrobacillus sp. MER TA 171]
MEKLLTYMKTVGNSSIQRIQLQHRLGLVQAFNIEKGMRVLEIGCGQGDTTVALADAVGETGFVMAIDIAGRDYGKPITLGEATDFIKSSPIGNRVSFDLEADFLMMNIEETYDVAILSHCLWYFQEPATLLSYLKRLKKVAKRICIAEWDLEWTKPEQLAHFYSASILAIYAEQFEDEGNIQNVFHKQQLKNMLKESGWNLVDSKNVDASFLQDGKWEVDYAISVREKFNRSPVKIQTLIQSYYALLEKASNKNVQSLNSIVLIAN